MCYFSLVEKPGKHNFLGWKSGKAKRVVNFMGSETYSFITIHYTTCLYTVASSYIESLALYYVYGGF